MARAEQVTRVRVTGPFAVHASRAWGRGVALVGDAADFFDPFTGEGLYTALRSADGTSSVPARRSPPCSAMIVTITSWWPGCATQSAVKV